MKRIFILILALALTLSLAACGNGNEGGAESTPEGKEPISMSAEEIYSVLANLYRSADIDLDMSKTRFKDGLSSTDEIKLACKGFGTSGFEYYVKYKNSINSFTDNVYVGGVLYTSYGDDIKIKGERLDYQAQDEFERELRAYPEMSSFDKSEITSDSEKATLTLTGISSGIFCEVILGIDQQDFDSVTDYEEACAAYTFDASKYVLSITVNAAGELVEITEDYSYGYSEKGDQTVSYDVKTKTVLGNNSEKIAVPEDADEYYEY